MKLNILLVSLAGCFLVLGCGSPNPEEICTHIQQVFEKDPNAAKFKKFDRANCVSNGEMKKELPAYKEYGRCAQGATTIEGVNECAKKMDAALGGR